MGELNSAAFLEYLDKEMTVMGILSAFSVGLAALTLERTAGADGESMLVAIWQHDAAFVVVGSVAALIAGHFFYLQRSLLAWYYGQITLCEIRDKGDGLQEWLDGADAWDTWFRHEAGFVLLTFSFFALGIATTRALVPEIRSCLVPSIVLPSLIVVLLLILGTMRTFLVKYRLKEQYPLWYLLPRKWRAA